MISMPSEVEDTDIDVDRGIVSDVDVDMFLLASSPL